MSFLRFQNFDSYHGSFLNDCTKLFRNIAIFGVHVNIKSYRQSVKQYGIVAIFCQLNSCLLIHEIELEFDKLQTKLSTRMHVSNCIYNQGKQVGRQDNRSLLFFARAYYMNFPLVTLRDWNLENVPLKGQEECPTKEPIFEIVLLLQPLFPRLHQFASTKRRI